MAMMLLFSIATYAEHRFFPANSIYTTARWISPRFVEGMWEEVEVRDTIYYNIWTGNDTIVDDRECVNVWHNYEGITRLYGVVYEDNTGLVYINHLLEENFGWEFLYDFTQRDWEVGDKIRTDFSYIEGWYETIEDVSSITLHNGEVVPYITTETTALIFGIGYYNTPAFHRPEDYNGFSPIDDLINFYRNGVLLWGKEYNPNSSVARPKTNNSDTPYYDLQGRPIANPTRGIYIKDGKKTFVSKE